MTQALIKAHYFIENISIDKRHPRDGFGEGRIPADKDPNKVVCLGHCHCDILEAFSIEGELHFLRIRAYLLPTNREVVGWTWSENVGVRYEEKQRDGRFNRKECEVK